MTEKLSGNYYICEDAISASTKNDIFIALLSVMLHIERETEVIIIRLSLLEFVWDD
jgi:hypothetical protein